MSEPEQLPIKINRERLPEERKSITHKFNIADTEGYIIVGLYPDGRPGEIFLTMAKEGSTLNGLVDSFAVMTSIALQHGVPLRTLCDKFSHTRFEPSGWSGNDDIGYAKSIMDYVFRWLEIRFLGVKPVPSNSPVPSSAAEEKKFLMDASAPACKKCGTIMQRAGSCYSCGQCGETSGCG